MICSYKRPDLLLKAIESLRASADPDNFEILIRFSDADKESIKRRKEFESIKNVRVFVGPQGNGYSDLGLSFTKLAKHAKGEWCSIFDDDMTIEGGRWDLELEKVEKPAMALCEFYTLGPSKYGSGACDGPGIGWFLPTRSWEKLGCKRIEEPPDTAMKKLLVDHHKWPIVWLKGITLNHQWQRPTDGNR